MVIFLLCRLAFNVCGVYRMTVTEASNIRGDLQNTRSTCLKPDSSHWWHIHRLADHSQTNHIALEQITALLFTVHMVHTPATLFLTIIRYLSVSVEYIGLLSRHWI